MTPVQAFILAVLTLILIPSAAALEVYQKELRALAMVESSGGKNVNHRRMESGPHASTKAGGHFGLMPLTVKWLIKGSPKLKEKYGQWLDASNDSITDELNHNTRMDREIALYFWKKLREHYSYSRERAACAWFWGPSAKRCKSPELNGPYVTKFRRYFSELEESSI